MYFAEACQRAAALIEQADGLLITAGAGMGVDSGLPDFRGETGFWKAYPALGRARIAFHEIASPYTFQRDPTLAWGVYGHRLQLYRGVQPHAGFASLRYWGERMRQGYAVLTSNVDGHFQKAGFAPDRVHECHGSIHYLQCLHDCCAQIWSAEALVPKINESACRLRSALPRCSTCGALARPNILMFADSDWNSRREREQARCMADFLETLTRPVVIEIGAGTAIPSVRNFSQYVLQAHAGRLIRINPRESVVSREQDVAITGSALLALQGIAQFLGPSWQVPPGLPSLPAA